MATKYLPCYIVCRRNALRMFRSSILLLLPLSSVVARAFDGWQQPTPEELKMTVDPVSPDAAAVYFFREEVSDDKLHMHSMYVRIKILTEKGKEYADVEIPYEGKKFSITNVSGRTIHSDGSMVPFAGKPYDKMYEKTKTQRYMAKIFTMPDVQVGSILEYRYVLRYDDDTVLSPVWIIQQDLYVHKAHYSFVPASTSFYRTITNSRGENLNQLMWSPILPKGSEVKFIHDHYEVDVNEIPPLPDEAYMPPMHSYSYRVIFYYTGQRSRDEFWKSEGKYWSKSVDHFANSSGKISAVVKEVIGPADTQVEKLHKIYAAVMKLDNTDFTRKHDLAENRAEGLKSAKTAEDIWEQKRGSSEEIAMLFLAMARASGMKAYAFEVVDRSRSIFNPNYLRFDQLDDMIVAVNVDGKEQLFDPGERMCGYGQLHWKHTSTGGVRQTDNGTEIAESKSEGYKDTQVARIASLTLDSKGQVSGQLRISMNGAEALKWRQRMLRNDEVEVKEQFEDSIREDVPPGVEIKFDHFLGLDDFQSLLMAILNVRGSMGTATQKRLMLPTSFFQFGSKPVFVDQKRQAPIDLYYPYQTSDQVVIDLPEDLHVESMPKDEKIMFPQNGVMQVAVKVDANKLTYSRVFALANVFFDPKEYEAVRGFYEKVAAKDQEETILQLAPKSGGTQ
jgi:hypothetical protein